jgi:hypothetical protein
MIALDKTRPFYGLKFRGRNFDCGSKIGFLAASVAYALARPDLELALREVLQDSSSISFVAAGSKSDKLSARTKCGSKLGAGPRTRLH